MLHILLVLKSVKSNQDRNNFDANPRVPFICLRGSSGSLINNSGDTSLTSERSLATIGAPNVNQPRRNERWIGKKVTWTQHYTYTGWWLQYNEEGGVWGEEDKRQWCKKPMIEAWGLLLRGPRCSFYIHRRQVNMKKVGKTCTVYIIGKYL